MILIVSQPTDEPAVEMVQRLQRRGAEVFWFDPAEYPERTEISFRPRADGGTGTIHRGSEVLELERVRVGWFCRPGKPMAPAHIKDEATRRFIEEDCRDFIHNLWSSLHCQWVPGPFPLLVQAEDKLPQLRLAQALGFEVPDTLVSNEPAEFLKFYQAHEGQVVSKLLGLGLHLHFNHCARYTQFVTPRDVAHFRSLTLSPVIFQAYVPKQVEIRATVVGERIFAAEIHSQATRRTRHDWRRYDLRHTPHFKHELPQDVAGRCLALVKGLGLCFGAIDLVLTPDGRYVFLEINASGQWQWIEALTGLPISDAICDLLLQRARAEMTL
jgi:hypothetical protein